METHGNLKSEVGDKVLYFPARTESRHDKFREFGSGAFGIQVTYYTIRTESLG
jgi:hypothetical protein